MLKRTGLWEENFTFYKGMATLSQPVAVPLYVESIPVWNNWKAPVVGPRATLKICLLG
jgi:hypothetical protein